MFTSKLLVYVEYEAYPNVLQLWIFMTRIEGRLGSSNPWTRTTHVHVNATFLVIPLLYYGAVFYFIFIFFSLRGRRGLIN